MTLDGNRVRRFLKDSQKTKEWLAVQLSCSIGTVDRVLAGKSPTAETLITLAKILGCKAEDLVTQQAHKRPA